MAKFSVFHFYILDEQLTNCINSNLNSYKYLQFMMELKIYMYYI